jgi:hypothetical protein
MHILCQLPASTIIPLHPQITLHNQLAHLSEWTPKIGSKLKRRMEKSIYKREIQELSLPLKKLFKNKSQEHLRERERWKRKKTKGKCQPP